MTKMSFRLAVCLVLLSLCCAGCIDISYEIVANSDGSFTLRQSVGSDDNIFAHELLTIRKLLHRDSDSMSEIALMDSIHRTIHLIASIQNERSSGLHGVLGLHGITSYLKRDTTIDNMTYDISEVRVNSADSLGGAFFALNNASDLSNGWPVKDTGNAHLTSMKTKQGIWLTFHFGGNNAIRFVTRQEKELLKNAAIHIRMFAPNLDKPKTKAIRPIAGGQEYTLKFIDILTKRVHWPVDVPFVLLSGR